VRAALPGSPVTCIPRRLHHLTPPLSLPEESSPHLLTLSPISLTNACLAHCQALGFLATQERIPPPRDQHPKFMGTRCNLPHMQRLEDARMSTQLEPLLSVSGQALTQNIPSTECGGGDGQSARGMQSPIVPFKKGTKLTARSPVLPRACVDSHRPAST